MWDAEALPAESGPDDNDQSGNDDRGVDDKGDQGAEAKESSPAESDLFEEFWKLVPIQRSKHTASKAYHEAIRDGATHEKIVAGLRSYHSYNAERRRENQPELHPTRWLSEKRWADPSSDREDTDGRRNRTSKLGGNGSRSRPKPVPKMPEDFVSWFRASMLNADQLTDAQIADKWTENEWRKSYEGRGG